MILHGDCLEVMRSMEAGSVDLVFCSPPYVDCRLYGQLNFKLKGQDWVDWARERFVECYRVSKGLVAWVVEGKTKQFQWDATPALLMADLHRAGVKLRKPPAFNRVGIPGSGGPDWLRNDYEFIVCASHGKLPWSDNTAMGHEPKYNPGGEMSHRVANGQRVNSIAEENGRIRVVGKGRHWGGADKTSPAPDGNKKGYLVPLKANPGNVIRCKVGGGLMGSDLAHENEAPFPESLAEFFVRSFCPPGGTVLDPFCGSGTTLAVAEQWGRKWVGIDAREDQCYLSKRRVAEKLDKMSKNKGGICGTRSECAEPNSEEVKAAEVKGEEAQARG